MFFEDIQLGMTVEIAPAVIEKEKMLHFARTYDNIPLQNIRKAPNVFRSWNAFGAFYSGFFAERVIG